MFEFIQSVPAYVVALVVLLLTVAYLGLPAFVLWRLVQAPAPVGGFHAMQAEPQGQHAHPDDAELTTTLLQHMRQQRPWLSAQFSELDLARHLALAPAQLQSLLQRAFNASFDDMVAAYRIEEAQRLLRDPGNAQVPASQLGLQAGFPHPGQFTHCFQQHTGMTPNAFRKRHQE